MVYVATSLLRLPFDFNPPEIQNDPLPTFVCACESGTIAHSSMWAMALSFWSSSHRSKAANRANSEIPWWCESTMWTATANARASAEPELFRRPPIINTANANTSPRISRDAIGHFRSRSRMWHPRNGAGRRGSSRPSEKQIPHCIPRPQTTRELQKRVEFRSG